jgi:hypothetical protein
MLSLELPADQPERVALAPWQVAAGATQVWPAEQPIQQLADPRIVGTRFQDSALIHPALTARILSAAVTAPAMVPGNGGKKIRDDATWATPAMEPGTMILFPAVFLHHVRPYSGKRPRITIAFNISAGPPPASVA